MQRVKQDGWGRRRHKRSRNFCRLLGRDAHKSFRKNSDSPHVLDLFVEFRNLTNGLTTPCGNGLLGALTYFGLSSIDAADKDSMRQLALRGGDYSEDEKQALLDYCETDVDALARLLRVMLPRIDLARALLRGRYMKAAAIMEFNGIPIDVETLAHLRQYWECNSGHVDRWNLIRIMAFLKGELLRLCDFRNGWSVRIFLGRNCPAALWI